MSSRALLRAPLVLGRSQHAALFLLTVSLVVYGSLVPFHFHRVPWGDAVNVFRTRVLPGGWGGWSSDWLSNCLLGIPLGYSLAGVFCVDLGKGWRWLVLLAVPFCAAVSISVEFAQLFFPPRVSSSADIAAQVVGALVGSLAWAAFGQAVANWGRDAWLRAGESGWSLRLLPAYLVCLVGVEMMPFDLALHPSGVLRKYRSGMIRLGLFEGWGLGDLWEEARRQLWHVLYFAPLGVLAAYLPGRHWGHWSGWWRVGLLGMAVAGGVECMQLLSASRFVNSTDVLTGTLAALAGWAVTLLAGRPQPSSASAVDGGSSRGLPGMRVLLGLLWLGVAVFFAWRPFNFDLDVNSLINRLNQLSLIPFADYHADKVFNALDQAVHKILLYVPLGALLASTVGKKRTWGTVAALLVIVVVAALLEFGQLLLPGRYASVTDILVESFGGWLGFVLFRRLLFGSPAREQSVGEVIVVYHR